MLHHRKQHTFSPEDGTCSSPVIHAWIMSPTVMRNLSQFACIWIVSLSISCGARTDLISFVGPINRSFQARHLTVRSQQETVVEPEKILTSEQINFLSQLVQKRAEARWQGDYDEADALRNELDRVDLPAGYFVSLKDMSRKDGGVSSWSLVRNTTETLLEGTTVLQLAHAALGLALASSERQVPVPKQQLQSLLSKASERLKRKEAVEPELRGRKAADAAFWFSLAGANDHFVMQSLSRICENELGRFGTRSSCREKDIWHILERLAAAGVRNDAGLERVGKLALASKGKVASEGMGNLLDFHSDRCLVMIWRFSTRQRKQRIFLESAQKHWERHQQDATGDNGKTNHDCSLIRYDWQGIYSEPTKPLVIDIGCGMGVSLLGLAQRCLGEENFPLVQEWSNCNFAGVDLSGMAIGFGEGMSKRWELQDRLHFFADAAEEFLHCVVDSYPGQVECCLVQFPTPYRLSNLLTSSGEKSQGNAQLPADTESGFMVNKSLLKVVHRALSRANGKLLVQSNCEDVAVWIKRTAEETGGFQAMDCSSFEDEGSRKQSHLTKRTLDWIEMGGERAEGEGWSKGPILPRIGRTETEVACSMNGVPVHRCLLKAVS